jgi:hypothetical protein
MAGKPGPRKFPLDGAGISQYADELEGYAKRLRTVATEMKKSGADTIKPLGRLGMDSALDKNIPTFVQNVENANSDRKRKAIRRTVSNGS